VPETAEARIRRWLDDCVLGLELCPFAAPVVDAGSLRIAASDAANPQSQLQAFLLELDRLQSADEDSIATTLLVLEQGPADFQAFMTLVDAAQELLEEAGLDELFQLAHFHPAYLFDGESPEGVSHLTNRSPLPVIHLLRESMLTRVLGSDPDAASIPDRNIARLESLSRQELQRRWPWLQWDSE